ncbi:hypothetical protein Dimus_025286 [Dionaea muscipula]
MHDDIPVETHVYVVTRPHDILVAKDEDDFDAMADPFSGGFIDVSPVRCFGTHVAAEIWVLKDDIRPYRVLSHEEKLVEWDWWRKENNGRFRALIEGSRLIGLVHGTFRFVNKALISAFVKRWVDYRLDIPIEGPFSLHFRYSLTSEDSGHAPHLLHEVLGVPGTEAHDERIARAYLLYLLGCMLLVDKIGTQLGHASQVGVCELARYSKFLEA